MKLTKKKTLSVSLRNWLKDLVEEFVRDAAKECHGALALLGIFSLNAGIFTLVYRSKKLQENSKDSQVALVAGPLLLVVGISMLMSSVIIYQRKKRKKRIFCCMENEMENDISDFYLSIISENDSHFLEDSKSYDSDNAESEEIRSAFRSVIPFDRGSYKYSRISEGLIHAPYQFMPCSICSLYAPLEYRYTEGCGCWFCSHCAGCVEYPLHTPQITLV